MHFLIKYIWMVLLQLFIVSDSPKSKPAHENLKTHDCYSHCISREIELKPGKQNDKIRDDSQISDSKTWQFNKNFILGD